jgi:hypothetical protein
MTHTAQRYSWIISGLLILAHSAVFAHHSGAMYDSTKPRTLTGTVKQFRWVNPHALIVLTTDAVQGEEAADWAVEMSSPGNMTRFGWTRMSLRSGEHVEIVVSPMRDGTHGGTCRAVTLLDRKQILECGAGAAIRAGERPNLP